MEDRYNSEIINLHKIIDSDEKWITNGRINFQE